MPSDRKNTSFTAGLICLMLQRRFSRIAQTACHSWAQLSNRWTYDIISRPLSSAFLVITELTCQFIPLFPNHSDCFSLFQLDELHGPVHDNKGGILLEGHEQILFCSLRVLSPDDMRLPLKNRLSGFIMVVFQVLFLLYVVKSYRRRFNFFSNCLNHGFQTFATQLAWCSWEQLPWNSGFWGSLKEKHIQWSGQGIPSS